MDEVLIPFILNKTLTNADTEYTVELPINCKSFSFQARDGATFRYAWVADKVATPTAPYMTNQQGAALGSPQKFVCHPSFRTLYLGTANAGTVVEIICFVSGASPY